ncbi:uncharacterized protein LOC142345703 isoform X2 [Convolutriloba macropyga]|uniref:uncharacterized protein LOC142345703 isoform X2 n=1 Tax=Convolutriloba macropyga TaxID=536237 RepID=UPI003F51EE1E
MSSSGARLSDNTQSVHNGASEQLCNLINDKSVQLFIDTDADAVGGLGKNTESLERNFLNQKSSSSTQHSTDEMLSSSTTSFLQSDHVNAVNQGSVPIEHQCSNSEQTAATCEQEETRSDCERVANDIGEDFSPSASEDFVKRCGDEVGAGSFLPEELNKVRYLSCSEFTMKQCMDIGVFTVGEMLQFATRQPITYEEILQCLTILRNKYEMLQLNTVKEEKSGKFYWAKLADAKVFTVENLGLLNEAEAQQKLNGIVNTGIKDGEPIWRFYFAEVEKSTAGRSDPVTSASQSSSSNPKMPSESASKLSPSQTSSVVPLTRSRSSSERESAAISEGKLFGYSYCVYFVMSHALVDGIGIANIIADFFTLLCTMLIHNSGEQSGSKNGGNPSDGSTDHSTSTDSEWPVQLTPVQVSPPYEELVPNLRLYRVMSLPLSFAFKRIMKTCLNMHKMPFFHHPIFKSPNLRPLMLQAPNTPVCTGTELLTFSPEEWSQFQAYRKRHGLTVSGLALAIFSTAMIKYAYNGTHWPTTTLAAHILRDPRRYFKKTELDSRALVANYIASGLVVLLPFFKRKRREHSKKRKTAGDSSGGGDGLGESGGRDMEKLVVDLAKLVTQQIRGNVKNFQTFFYGEVQRRLSKDTQLVKQFVDVFSSHPSTCGRMTMIQFSNIGEVSCVNQALCGDFNSISVQKSIALADQSKSGDCFCNVLMTIQGRLHWTISYPTHLYPPDKVAAMASEMRQLWSHIIRPESIDTTNCDPINNNNNNTEIDISGISNGIDASKDSEHSK